MYDVCPSPADDQVERAEVNVGNLSFRKYRFVELLALHRPAHDLRSDVLNSDIWTVN